MTLKEMQQQLGEQYTHANALRMQYEGKEGGMTATEEEEFETAMKAAEDTKSLIAKSQRETRVLTIEKWQNEMTSAMRFNGGGRPGAIDRPNFRSLGLPELRPEEQELNDSKLPAYKAYLRGISEQDSPSLYYKNTREYQDYIGAVRKVYGDNQRAYQADDPAGGGFMVPPQELIAEILTLMKDYVFIRGLATEYTVVNADSLGVPAIDTDPSDSDWTVELGTGNEETTLALGKRELRPSPLAKRIKLSKKLLRQVPNSDSIILDRLAYKAAVTEEKAFLTGSGANQPLGILTAGAQGISTSRDTTTTSNSAITGDEIITTFYALKAQYRARAAWMLYRTTVSAVRKLKDSSNSYIWQPGLNGFVAQGTALIGSQPETLMGRPIYESEYVPAIAASTYVAVVGDMKQYWICDALNMTIQVLYELYAATNQMGYILRKETDGMPVLEEAFSRLIMHS